MMIDFFQPETRRGMFLQMMASRKTVPPRMLRMVPLGLFHIFFSLNSSTLASSGVMVAHLMPTLYFLIASAHSTVTAGNCNETMYYVQSEGRERAGGDGEKEERERQKERERDGERESHLCHQSRLCTQFQGHSS